MVSFKLLTLAVLFLQALGAFAAKAKAAEDVNETPSHTSESPEVNPLDS